MVKFLPFLLLIPLPVFGHPVYQPPLRDPYQDSHYEHRADHLILDLEYCRRYSENPYQDCFNFSQPKNY